MRYRFNTPDVIEEAIEGEVIIVHLGTGRYYSLAGSAAVIWDGIGRGLDSETILKGFTTDPDTSRSTVGEALGHFLEELQREDLIVDIPGEAPEANLDANRPPATFSPPILHKYTDMQELLLLDPIHEVKETGWPDAKKTSPD